MRFHHADAFALLGLGLAALSCSSLYYGTMERLGWEKRHILADRVRDGQEEQQEAQQQFKTTYQRFKEASGYDGGDLEDLYERLSRELARSEEKAQDVRGRIRAIEDVAADLFEEWQVEAQQISNTDLRRQSESKLRDTRKRYAALIAAMKRAEAKMDPVVVAFRDQVLFLKHNLNAAAVESLESNVVAIEGDVNALIREMDAAIRESESFLASMEGGAVRAGSARRGKPPLAAFPIPG